MTKKAILLSLLTLTVLFALLAGTQTAQAQHTPEGKPFILVSALNITSPTSGTYNSQLLTLNLTAKSFLDSAKANITMQYSIDGAANKTLQVQSVPVPIETEVTDANGTKYKGISIMSYYLITSYATLPELSEGTHNITVYAKYDFPNSNIGLDSKTVNFTVNGDAADNIDASQTVDPTAAPPSQPSVDYAAVAAAVAVGVLAAVFLLMVRADRKVWRKKPA